MGSGFGSGRAGVFLEDGLSGSVELFLDFPATSDEVQKLLWEI